MHELDEMALDMALDEINKVLKLMSIRELTRTDYPYVALIHYLTRERKLVTPRKPPGRPRLHPGTSGAGLPATPDEPRRPVGRPRLPSKLERHWIAVVEAFETYDLNDIGFSIKDGMEVEEILYKPTEQYYRRKRPEGSQGEWSKPDVIFYPG